MDFKQAVLTCVMEKRFNWQDRATRSEFWWFYLASIGINIVASILGVIPILGALISLVVGIALTWLVTITAIRRLHDTDRRGWWMLLPLGTCCVGFIPMVMGAMAIRNGESGTGWMFIGVLIALSGVAYVLYLLTKPGTEGPNRFGPAPVCAACAAPQVENSAPAEMPQDNNEQK